MLFYLLLAGFGLLTIFFCVCATLHIIWLHGQLKAKDREAAELRGALRLFEDVRQAVGYLSTAYTDLCAFHGNLQETHGLLVKHASAVFSQAERVRALAEGAGGDEGGGPHLTAFRPDPDHITRN